MFHMLDQGVVKGVLATIADLAGEGMTMLVVTHEMGFALGVADTVHFMDRGQVVESGPPEQLFEAASSHRLQPPPPGVPVPGALAGVVCRAAA